MTAMPTAVDDTALALALSIAGIEPIKVENRYRKEFLQREGLDPEKLGAIPAAFKAIERGLPGHRIYFYDRSEALDSVLAAYYDQKRRNEAQEPVELQHLNAEEVVRIARCVLDRRKAFHELWRTYPAFYWEVKGGNVERSEVKAQGTKDGQPAEAVTSATETHPGEILLSVKLSEELRKAMRP